MDAVIRIACAADVPSIAALLRDNGLPGDGVVDRLSTTLVAATDADVVGTGALEIFPDGALLRSVAVVATRRGSGVGAELVEALLAFATERGADAVYLLTTTAEAYFPRFGFERVARDVVPAAVRASHEFTSACPASAVVMRKALNASD